MKKKWMKAACVVFCSSLIATSAFATAISMGEETDEGFEPKADTTWGDVYRYFDAEEFEALPAAVQEQLDNQLLLLAEEGEVNASGMEDMAFASGYLVTEEAQKVEQDVTEDMTWAYDAAYIYASEAEDGLMAQDIDIVGFTNLFLGVSSTTSTIEYTATVSATVKCPYLYVGVTIYDVDTGRLVDLDSTLEDDTYIANADGTFTGLQSDHLYKVIATGVITPPAGYFASGNLTQQIEKRTK